MWRAFIWLGLAMLLAIPVARAEPVTFIALGDMPYRNNRVADPLEQFKRFQDVIVPAVKAADAAFVVHYGDFKGGAGACDLAGLSAARDTILGLKPGRVLYTPGDNDWTDCDRRSTGAPVSELQQLSELRRLFYGGATESEGVIRQPNYPENARWRVGEVLFLTLHLVGTNNGRVEILEDDVDLALARVEARDQANRVWLAQSVNEARRGKAKAMVIVTQADVTNPDGAGACTPTNRANCDAFAEIRGHLRLAARQFRRPVLLIHGDTYPYCWDKAFGGARASNLWRLNGPGDYKIVDAAKVTVDPDNQQAPFSATSLLDGVAPDPRCQ